MGRFRKKPVVVEAFQWVTVPATEKEPPMIGWLSAAFSNGDIWVTRDPFLLHIRTLEGEMVAEQGDWIIRGVKGEIYPCKPDIFEQTYEAVDEQD